MNRVMLVSACYAITADMSHHYREIGNIINQSEPPPFPRPSKRQRIARKKRAKGKR